MDIYIFKIPILFINIYNYINHIIIVHNDLNHNFHITIYLIIHLNNQNIIYNLLTYILIFYKLDIYNHYINF